MLESLPIFNGFGSDVQTEYIYDILCQIFHYYIQQYHDENI